MSDDTAKPDKERGSVDASPGAVQADISKRSVPILYGAASADSALRPSWPESRAAAGRHLFCMAA